MSIVKIYRKTVISTLFILFFNFLFIFDFYGAEKGFKWKVIKKNGREYVTSRELKDFYNFVTYSVSNKVLQLRGRGIVLKNKVGTHDLFINGVRFVMNFPTVPYSSRSSLISCIDLVKLIDPILRPKYIKTARPFDTVVIDPGHGGTDTGGQGRYLPEKVYVLDIGLRLRKELLKYGFRVAMTRNKDVFPSLPERAVIANNIKNSIFVSIHCNALRSSQASGIETYILPPKGVSDTFETKLPEDNLYNIGNIRDSENIALAGAVHGAIMYKNTSIDRGIKRNRLFLLREIKRPSILIECGFITNVKESRKLNKKEYRQLIAQRIGIGIVNFHKSMLDSYKFQSQVKITRSKVSGDK